MTPEQHPGVVEVQGLVDNLFRRTSSQIVAYLTRQLGSENIDLAEEAVQDALIKALQAWPYSGVPENPGGWLFQVAKNTALDAVRRNTLITRKHPELLAELSRRPQTTVEISDDFANELRDDELRMLFLCCHPALSPNLSVPLALKIVGGFGMGEIARALLSNDTTIAQRIVRAKRQIRDSHLSLELPEERELAPRLDAVLEVIYLIFNEGYAAYQGEDLIRTDLCDEALRLGKLVSDSPLSAPRVHALVSLIAFQAARIPARVDEQGNMVLLEEQDRTKWDQKLVTFAFHHLERSARGEEISVYHIQAAIASIHAHASSGRSTDWKSMLQLYDDLLQATPSPVVALNRAVAVSKVFGAAEALEEIRNLASDPLLSDYYLLPAVRGRLLLEIGEAQQAADAYQRALQCPCSEPERKFLRRKFDECKALLGRE